MNNTFATTIREERIAKREADRIEANRIRRVEERDYATKKMEEKRALSKQKDEEIRNMSALALMRLENRCKNAYYFSDGLVTELVHFLNIKYLENDFDAEKISPPSAELDLL